MRACLFLALLLGAVFSTVAPAQKKYSGPRPPKPDVPFLLSAGRLTELESGNASQSEVKDNMVFTVPGASSSVQTPVPEPIFLFQADKINPDRLSLYRMTVANGKRSLTFQTGKKSKNAPKPVYFLVTPLDGALFRVEVNEYIEAGEYCFSPDGSNQVFCFTTL
jgi:hypothetical protein